MEKVKITFIGCGNMGRSLIGGLINNGFPPARICGTDIDPKQRELTVSRYGIEVLDDNLEAVNGVDVVVIGVKPQMVKTTLLPLRETLAESRPLLLSIAAGIKLEDLARWSGEGLPIVRIMPNTPALVSTGAAALCANKHVNDAQHDIAETIMRSVGITIWVDDEVLIDAVTALSGSGPAYYFYFMEIMEKAGMELGLTKDQSRLLTLQTALGAAKMAMESNDDPEILRKQVTSPGGTTERALDVLQQNKLEKTIKTAVHAAFDRAQELATMLGKEK